MKDPKEAEAFIRERELAFTESTALEKSGSGEIKRYSVVMNSKFLFEVQVDARNEEDAKFIAADYRSEVSRMGPPLFGYADHDTDEHIGPNDVHWERFDSVEHEIRAVELLQGKASEEVK